MKMYITPGSPWENGYVESFNGTMANELLNKELFDTLEEAKVLLARWVKEYNTKRPHVIDHRHLRHYSGQYKRY